MATLTNTKIKDTYDGLLKTTDNDVIGASEKVITDGLGNASVLSIGTASASFSSDIEVNTLTIGKGANDVTTNTALGYQTLENATGGGNTAVGYGGLLYTTTGVQNTAVGLSALQDNTTGSYNTALGSITLDVNTEGNHNVAVGYRSLAFNTTGQKNVAVGSEALSTQTIGSFSTAVGYEALMSQTTGSNNTAVGYASMRTSTTGTYNTAIGVASLYDNTTGSTNVAIGRYALTNNVSGDSNVGIGTNSGNQLTTGSNNIYIGNTAVGSAADNDNEIVIGASTTGNGSNTATYGNSSITDHHFTSGTVRINSDYLRLTGATNPQVLVTDTTNSVSVGLQALDASTKIDSTHSFKIEIGNDIIQSVTSSGVEITGNLAVDTNTLYVDAANNRVGIGTSIPATPLTIQHSTQAQISFDNDYTTNNWIFGIAGDTSGDGIIYNPAAYNFQLWTNNQERMRIDSSGHLTIGKSNYDPRLYMTSTGGNGINERFYIDGFADGGGSGYGGGFRIHTRNTVNVFEERMRIDSSGRVLVNTQTPQNTATGRGNVTINGTTSILNLATSDTNSGYIYHDSTNMQVVNSKNGIMNFYTNDTERMRIDSSGNVGIGTDVIPFDGLRINGTGSRYLNITSGAGASAGILLGDSNDTFDGGIVYDNSSQSMLFYSADSERMRITSGGDVFIGTTNPATDNGVGLYDTGQIYTHISGTNATPQFIFYRNSSIVGSIQTDGTSTSYITSSDYRLKENVVDMVGALDRVDALKPSRFNFIADPEKTVDGFLAHEVHAIVPEAVTGEKDAVDEEGNPIYQGIDQSKLTPLLTAALKEAHALIKSLEARIEILENK